MRKGSARSFQESKGGCALLVDLMHQLKGSLDRPIEHLQVLKLARTSQRACQRDGVIVKAYLVALSVGALVGIIYGALNVRSPAPPIIALVVLFGMLVGEQIPPLVKRVLSGKEVSVSAVAHICSNHVFGQLPTRSKMADQAQVGDKAADTPTSPV